jgi:hypothetical protein
MSRGQRTNKDLQKSSSKSDLSVLENLFSHISVIEENAFNNLISLRYM